MLIGRSSWGRKRKISDRSGRDGLFSKREYSILLFFQPFSKHEAKVLIIFGEPRGIQRLL
jgi:hypothetical protein